MIKRDITETVCEYDNEGKLVKKTVTETHEEEDNTTFVNNPSWTYLNGTHHYCDGITLTNKVDRSNIGDSDSTTTITG